MQRTLELTIRLNKDTFEVDVYEPETGDVKQMQFEYSPDEHPEFDVQLGNEIYSWISMWIDAEEGEEE